MEIECTKNQDSAIVRLRGRFDAHETDAARKEFDGLVSQGEVNIVVDLSEVLFIDSSALAELVRGMKHCREQRGDLVLQAPSDPVLVILELTGLVKAFTVVAPTS